MPGLLTRQTLVASAEPVSPFPLPGTGPDAGWKGEQQHPGRLEAWQTCSNRTLFPRERGIGSLREAFSGGETQLVDCASSIFQYESPAWQKVCLLGPQPGHLPIGGTSLVLTVPHVLRTWPGPIRFGWNNHSWCMQNKDRTHTTGSRALLFLEHLTGGINTQQHRQKPPAAISSFLIYQREDGLCFVVETTTGTEGHCFFLLTA